ncbi:MAG: aconitate hydratase [Deltaproteobacteria bacterium RIFCSPLOWO2_02_FULL_42_39]|nr:MAG: aconitate hydratase [Deltaproteobacteria bacterium GWD2_42_10]OGQ24579.1 MAG: aconitate hydratase [Deltaproteobacteria bacterium RIFCSPHIGHO2_02_FULL_42_44]OGQ35697.1 MAG: aconitate hydratase [Deltaproteobacteria bacterium RIFCSPLOWO2_02_FULL_42_39]
MKKPLARKILEKHILSGRWEPDTEIGIRIDQTLTQDATGTLAYLEFEALGIDQVKTELSVSYVDHNLLQTDFKNADDHRFLQTVAEKYGICFSPPGNGVSHQVHMERFGIPGKTLLGSDSHTSTGGGLGMIAIGSGGLDVALAMAGEPFYLQVPKIFGVRLIGMFSPWVSGKDVILEMLRRHSVKGGLGKIIEYFGPGVKHLAATDRATIANMGAELGATTTIFPSDERVKEFMVRQGRGSQWIHLDADEDAHYDEVDEIDLTKLEPLIACPTSPDNIKKVSEVEGIPVQQVIIGSSVNSSFRDLMIVCEAIEGKRAHPQVSLEINPGSRQALENVIREGGALALTHAGARIHQSGCLGCIGMGQAPSTGTVSLRTFPRNFPGRSGTENDQVYLCSPETAIAAAIFGKITDPRKLGDYPDIVEPEKFMFNEELIIKPLPPAETKKVNVIRGPNIVPFPKLEPLPAEYSGEILLKVGDNITTDHILSGGNDVLPLRSNIPAISEHVYERVDKTFYKRCTEKGGGIIIGSENYGQGSSREHAALAPRYLGVQIKIAKSFARIHRSNLINFGIVPLLFSDPSDYEKLKLGDRLRFPDLRKQIEAGKDEVTAECNGREIKLKLRVTDRERKCILEGGYLNLVKKEV